MSDFPADQYRPLMFGLMIAFVVGALLFILAGEFVRRRMIGHARRHELEDRRPQERHG